MSRVNEITTSEKKLNYELLIRSASGIYKPILYNDITLEMERKGSPSKLTFTVIKDDVISFAHGNQVQFKVNGKGVFMGFVFDKSRDKSQHIRVTAYDQLRYFKNKDTYIYTNKTASDVLKLVAKDFLLKVGTIENTSYIIASRSESDKTLFDIIQNALDLTLVQTGKLYVLYDNFGKIELKNFENLNTNIVIDSETAQDFDYSSTINESCNKIKLVKEYEKTKKREIYEVKDNTHIGEWGVLQHYEVIQEEVNGKSRAEELLKIKNNIQRDLTVKGCFGDLSVRAGSCVLVNLHLGDKIIDNKRLLCERVTHYFSNDYHTMDLTLVGNKYVFSGGL